MTHKTVKMVHETNFMRSAIEPEISATVMMAKVAWKATMTKNGTPTPAASELLSGTLAALNEAGWPLRSLGEALGISRQAVQARVRRRARAGLRDPGVPYEPPPPFPQRRVASPAGLRPHLTIKIDQTLRVSAHRAAADEGNSLTQVVEAILDRYLRHGMADGDQAPREGARIGD